jgi:hypothetical protein
MMEALTKFSQTIGTFDFVMKSVEDKKKEADRQARALGFDSSETLKIYVSREMHGKQPVCTGK